MKPKKQEIALPTNKEKKEQKPKKSSVHSGALNKYTIVKKKMIARGGTFKIKSTPSMSILNVGNREMRFGGTKGQNKYIYLCRLVKTDARKFIKKHKIVPPKKWYYPTVNYISPNIASFQGKNMLYTDLNKCYANVALQMGIISQSTYDRLDKIPPKDKVMRQVAIGSLATVYHIEKYVDGKLVYKKPEKNSELRYVHFMILDFVDSIMNDLIKILGDDFAMWQTDCVYYNPTRREEVYAYLSDRGFTAKDKDVLFLDYDDKKRIIYWKLTDNPNKIKYAHKRSNWRLREGSIRKV